MVAQHAEVYLSLSMHACATGSWSLFWQMSEVDLFYDFLCTKQICSISGHLLNLPTNYIHVIFVQQWFQNTQKFTFDSMHAWVTAFFTFNKRLGRPFSMGTNPCFRTLVEPGLQLYPRYLCSAMAAKRLELSLWLSMHACVTRCFTFSKGPK